MFCIQKHVGVCNILMMQWFKIGQKSCHSQKGFIASASLGLIETRILGANFIPTVGILKVVMQEFVFFNCLMLLGACWI